MFFPLVTGVVRHYFETMWEEAASTYTVLDQNNQIRQMTVAIYAKSSLHLKSSE